MAMRLTLCSEISLSLRFVKVLLVRPVDSVMGDAAALLPAVRRSSSGAVMMQTGDAACGIQIFAVSEGTIRARRRGENGRRDPNQSQTTSSKVLFQLLSVLNLNHLAESVSSPEKAGVGGSIPSLATILNQILTSTETSRPPSANVRSFPPSY